MTDKDKNINKVPNSTNHLPKLRFPEFSEKWEVKKLGDVCEINPKNGNLPNSFIYIDLESVIDGVLLKEETVFGEEAPSRAQRLLSKNDILFQMVRPYQKNNLYFDKEGDYVASTGYAQIRTLQNSQFVFQYLHNQKFVDKVIERCTGTSYPAINSKDLGNIQLYFPSIQEQKMIADFLSSLDSKIQTQRKTIQNLETLIKGVSQKLFTQKIRFKEFSDNWEVKTLGEICDYKNGGSFENLVTVNGKYFLITLNSIDINGRLKNEHKTLNKTDNSLSKDDLVMVLSDVAHGNFLGLTDIIPNNYYVLNQRMGALKPKIEVNRFFLKSFINFNQKYFKLMGQGSSQQNLSKDDILKFKVQLPTLEEQTKIADFLSKISDKIETEKKILELLEQQKKYFLQNMFI